MSLPRMHLAALVAGMVLLSACGDDGATAADPDGTAASAESSAPSASAEPSPSPSATTPAPGAGAPDCEDVWKQEARLPRSYRGCNERRDGAVTFVPRQVLSCSSGQRMVMHADHYYAVLGGTIHRTESRLSKDRRYGEAVARCRG